MAYTLTEKQIDKLDDIFDEDKASALRKMLKPGLFQKSGLPIDAVDEKGRGLLSNAAFDNAVKCMQVLVDAGADVNQRNEYGYTPLHYAAGLFHTEAVRLLLAAGADPTVPNEDGDMPLNLVRSKECAECRQMLKAAMRARGLTVPDGPLITLDELHRQWNREAIIFHSKSAEQQPVGMQSWLGRVAWQLPGETRPTDTEGTPLEPLATLFIRDLPYIPAPLKSKALITIFAPKDAWSIAPDEDSLSGCVIRCYATTEGLEPCDYAASEFAPCLLTPEHVRDDIPKWPDCGGSDEQWEQVCELEISLNLDYQENIFRQDYETHKLGGYPTYAQDAPEMPEGYEFVLQISSDFELGLDIGDCGRYYFFYNPVKDEWRVHMDCY